MHILTRRPEYCLCYTNVVFNAVLVFLFFPLLTKAALRFQVQMKSLTTKESVSSYFISRAANFVRSQRSVQD